MTFILRTRSISLMIYIKHDTLKLNTSSFMYNLLSNFVLRCWILQQKPHLHICGPLAAWPPKKPRLANFLTVTVVHNSVDLNPGRLSSLLKLCLHHRWSKTTFRQPVAKSIFVSRKTRQMLALPHDFWRDRHSFEGTSPEPSVN